MICTVCKGSDSDFTTICGHTIHIQCLTYSRNNRSYIDCPECGKSMQMADMYWDIIKDADIKENGCEISNGNIFTLYLALSTKDDVILSKFIERLYLHKQTDDAKVSIIEHSLKTGDRRLLKILKKHKFAGRFTGIRELIETAWKNDYLEAINDAWEIGIQLPYYDERSDPLLDAASNGNFDLMRRLIDGGADLNRLTVRGSALYLAFTSNKFENFKAQSNFLDLLFDFGANLKEVESNYQHNSGQCPYMHPVLNNNIELVKYLLDRGANISQFTWNLALEKGLLEMVHLLHESGVNLLEYEESRCLYYASKSTSIEMVKYVLNLIIILSKTENLKDNSSLKVSINYRNLEITEILLQYGVQVDEDILGIALSRGNFDLVKLLISYGADRGNLNFLLDFNFEPSLKEGVEKISEILEYFLSLHVDVNLVEINGHTALSKLCRSDANLIIIEKLIEFGAKISLKDIFAKADTQIKSIYCPLIIASRHGCPNILKFLIRNGADFTDETEDGWNCYFCAIFSEILEVVKITLALCDKNHVDHEGNGPFHLIAQFNIERKAIEVFEYLSQLGVNMNIFNNNNRHPLLDKDIHSSKRLLIHEFLKNEQNANFRFSLGYRDLLDGSEDDIY